MLTRGKRAPRLVGPNSHWLSRLPASVKSWNDGEGRKGGWLCLPLRPSPREDEESDRVLEVLLRNRQRELVRSGYNGLSDRVFHWRVLILREHPAGNART